MVPSQAFLWQPLRVVVGLNQLNILLIHHVIIKIIHDPQRACDNTH